MRQIVLDTETTGLSPSDGHKITEIGCVELINGVQTGNVFHQYINPERNVPPEVVQITGLTEEFLKQFPIFIEVAESFLNFIQDSQLVIHNAKFDMNFINFELNSIGKAPIPIERALDTLVIARKKFPGQSATLDALSKRFAVNIPRDKHGALLDAQILAEVYIELSGGRQRLLDISDKDSLQDVAIAINNNRSFPKRSFPVDTLEIENFEKMLKKIKSPMWSL